VRHNFQKAPSNLPRWTRSWPPRGGHVGLPEPATCKAPSSERWSSLLDVPRKAAHLEDLTLELSRRVSRFAIVEADASHVLVEFRPRGYTRSLPVRSPCAFV